jgi:uncharacterized protein
MEVKHSETDHKGSFYTEQDGIIVAQLRYNFAGGDRLVVEQTAVSDSLQGHGIGNQLVDAIVSYARDNGYKIVAVCPFARSVFEKFEAYHDVYRN